VREIYGNAFHAVYDQFVLERIRNEMGKQALAWYEAADAIIPTVAEGFPNDILADAPLVLLYFLRDKRTMTGAFFDKTLGLRAFAVDAPKWVGVQVCLVCDSQVFPSEENFYVLRHKDLKPNNLFMEKNMLVLRVSRFTRDFGGPLEAGFNVDRTGLTVCVECANGLMACDPHELSLLATLLSKADKAHVRVLEKAALESLSWRERWALKEEKMKASREKKALLRNVEIAAQYELDSDGVLRVVE
jgi:hypothetical protein